MKKRVRWSSRIAYVVGLIATDGCLINDGRHINLTSKDLQLLEITKNILKLTNTIGQKKGGFSSRVYYQIQFGHVNFYNFLLKTGVTPNKSKTLGALQIPDKYFADYLRGVLDGDGYTFSGYDPRWKNSFRLYTGFVSASKANLEWISSSTERLFGVKGRIKTVPRALVLQFAKRESVILLGNLYYKSGIPSLERKRSKIEASLSIISG